MIRVESSGEMRELALNLDALLINVVLHVIIPAIVLSPVLWLVGRALVGKDKAKFTDAIWIILLGTLFGSVFSAFFTGIIASIIQLIVWLALVKHFFDCGWLMAFAISIVAVIIFIAIALLLGLLGYGIWTITGGIGGITV
jgi:hypothetical protein